MYEGNILNLGSIASWDDVAPGTDQLQTMSWNELILRLQAARDLRYVLDEKSPGTKGSFNHSSARRLSASADRQRRINPFALTVGKPGEA